MVGTKTTNKKKATKNKSKAKREIDFLICGTCKVIFNELHLFITHKQTICNSLKFLLEPLQPYEEEAVTNSEPISKQPEITVSKETRTTALIEKQPKILEKEVPDPVPQPPETKLKNADSVRKSLWPSNKETSSNNRSTKDKSDKTILEACGECSGCLKTEDCGKCLNCTTRQPDEELKCFQKECTTIMSITIFEVEEILSKRFNGGKLEYLLKCKIYSDNSSNSGNFWMPFEKFRNKRLVDEFEASNKAQQRPKVSKKRPLPKSSSPPALKNKLEDERIRRCNEHKPLLEEYTEDSIDDNQTFIHLNTIQLVESELPLSQADNKDELSGMYLFRQIYSPNEKLLYCLLCLQKHSFQNPIELEEHYQTDHALGVQRWNAIFSDTKVFVCVPSDIVDTTTLNSICKFCEITLKNLDELQKHYPEVHEKTVHLIKGSDVAELATTFYCSICSNATDVFLNHRAHMTFVHQMQICDLRHGLVQNVCSFVEITNN